MNNLSIEPVFLGSKSGEVEISFPFDNNGSVISEYVGKLAIKWKGKKKIEKVKVSTLDSLLTNLNEVPVSIIKIDVQGNELELLKGATKTLNKYIPALIIEIEDQLFESPSSNRAALKEILESHNYKIFLLDDALTRRYLPADLDLPIDNDFLELPI